jgi:hypothetical protein
MLERNYGAFNRDTLMFFKKHFTQIADNNSLVFVIFINFFGQLKDLVGQVLFLVTCSCLKGQVKNMLM